MLKSYLFPQIFLMSVHLHFSRGRLTVVKCKYIYIYSSNVYQELPVICERPGGATSAGVRIWDYDFVITEPEILPTPTSKDLRKVLEVF